MPSLQPRKLAKALVSVDIFKSGPLFAVGRFFVGTLDNFALAAPDLVLRVAGECLRHRRYATPRCDHHSDQLPEATTSLPVLRSSSPRVSARAHLRAASIAHRPTSQHPPQAERRF